MTPRRTAAWPLAWMYALLVVYASLYPFDQWRAQGIAPWTFLWAPLPRYWTAFDVVSNVLGYAPLGFLGALALHRTRPHLSAVAWATLSAGLLSLSLESMQMFLSTRVPSNVDWALNTAGALGGAMAARVLEWAGWLDRWSRFRDRWFVADASGAMAFLALWPPALLFPVAVPFGLGQVLERLEVAVVQEMQGSPLLDLLPLREVELQPLLPINEVLCMAMGVLVPCLLAYSVLRQTSQRLLAAAALLVVGLLSSALSAALTYGPSHTWDWVSAEVLMAGGLAGLTCLALSRASARFCWVLTLVLLVWQLVLLNNASADRYFVQTLQTWEQGRFIRFHGVIQWLGWFWPFALLIYLFRRLSRSSAP